MSTETSLFEDRYEITVLDTLTRQTSHASYLVYKLVPVIPTREKERRFVALFAREQDAYDYVALMTAIDAGLAAERLVTDLYQTTIEQAHEEINREDDGQLAAEECEICGARLGDHVIEEVALQCARREAMDRPPPKRPTTSKRRKKTA